MAKKNPYIIQYAGLKSGSHSFNFEIDGTFFSSFEYSDIESCQLNIDLRFEKSNSMLVLHFYITGTIDTVCDRCMDDLKLDVEGQNRQIVKISDFEEQDIDDEILVVSSSEYEVDITKIIFDFSHLCLPIKREHADNGCDPTILKKLENHLVFENPEENNQNEEEQNNEEEIDPRWNALKGLKDNK